MSASHQLNVHVREGSCQLLSGIRTFSRILLGTAITTLIKKDLKNDSPTGESPTKRISKGNNKNFTLSVT
jgi:hypothetical protein